MNKIVFRILMGIGFIVLTTSVCILTPQLQKWNNDQAIQEYDRSVKKVSDYWDLCHSFNDTNTMNNCFDSWAAWGPSFEARYNKTIFVNTYADKPIGLLGWYLSNAGFVLSIIIGFLLFLLVDFTLLLGIIAGPGESSHKESISTNTNCSICQSKNDKDAKYCQECGTILQKEE